MQLYSYAMWLAVTVSEMTYSLLRVTLNSTISLSFFHVCINCRLMRVVVQLKGLPADEMKDEVNHMLSDLGLEDKRQARVKTLSGGMKRKLSVGIALVGGSKVGSFDKFQLMTQFVCCINRLGLVDVVHILAFQA